MYEKELQEVGQKLTKVTGEIDTILQAAVEDDNRQLTDEERTKIDALESDAKQYQGEQESIQADRQRFSRQGDRKTFLNTPMDRLSPSMPLSVRGTDIGELEKALINAKRSSAKLRGFTCEKDAYLTGQWLRAALFGRQDARGFLERNAPQMLDMSSINDAGGGVLVPNVFSNALTVLREEYGLARRKCDIAPMTSDSLDWPRWVSGVTAYAIGENTAITESQPAFNSIHLQARKWGALTQIPTELMDDAVIDVANIVADNIAYAFAVKEDQCLFLGTGASTYHGIVGLITACAAATATIATALTANTAYSTLDMADFEEMIGMLPEFPGIRPEWYISKVGWAASMARLTDAVGGVTMAEVAGGPSRTMFLGYPVNWVQCMNTTTSAQTSTNGLCYLGDLRMAVTFGDRRAVTIKTLVERYAEYDQVGIVGTERMDINVHDVGDTSVAGAVIMLATPSS